MPTAPSIHSHQSLVQELNRGQAINAHKTSKSFNSRVLSMFPALNMSGYCTSEQWGQPPQEAPITQSSISWPQPSQAPSPTQYDQRRPTPSCASHRQFTMSLLTKAISSRTTGSTCQTIKMPQRLLYWYCFGQAPQNHWSSFKAAVKASATDMDRMYEQLTAALAQKLSRLSGIMLFCSWVIRCSLPHWYSSSTSSEHFQWLSGFSILEAKSSEEFLKSVALPATAKRILQRWQDEAEKVPPDLKDPGYFHDFPIR